MVGKDKVTIRRLSIDHHVVCPRFLMRTWIAVESAAPGQEHLSLSTAKQHIDALMQELHVHVVMFGHRKIPRWFVVTRRRSP